MKICLFSPQKYCFFLNKQYIKEKNTIFLLKTILFFTLLKAVLEFKVQK